MARRSTPGYRNHAAVEQGATAMSAVIRRAARSLALCSLPLWLACTAPSRAVRNKPVTPPPAPLLPRSEPEAWRRQQPPSGAAGNVHIPSPHLETLNNGLAIYTIPRATGVVSLSVVARHGAEATSPGKSGLAALVARMLTESTVKRDPFQLAEAAESFGSTLQAAAQRDFIEVTLEALPADTEQAIELLSEVVREPAFSNRDFERVRSQWLDDLLAERQSPSSLAALVGIRSLYGAYRGAPVNGSVPDVKKLQLSDLKGWHAQYVVPSSSALIAVGPIDATRIVQTAKRAFGGWRGTTAPTPTVHYAVTQSGSDSVFIVDRKDAVQSAVFAVQQFPRRLEKGHEARLVLNDIFGGLFTSRINMNLREAHAYTYGAHSSVVANRNFGAFVVQTNVRTDATAAALREIIAELTAIAGPKPPRPIGNDELARARADLVHRLGARLEQNQYLASDIATLFVQGLGTEYFANLPGVYSLMNADEVAAQAAGIRPTQCSIVVVGDREKIEKPLINAGFKVRAPDPAWLD